MRVGLFRISDERHLLLIQAHRILFDAPSMGVLIREISALYETFAKNDPPSLPAVPLQYAEFSASQRTALRGELLSSRLAYWRNQLAELPALELATDTPRKSQTIGTSAREQALL
ncbi:MAG: hypothetical protein IIA44_11455, partial [Acidobacteria bacterium]|nr:hypothetical protein [Acidobacteriota bacterium]